MGRGTAKSIDIAVINQELKVVQETLDEVLDAVDPLVQRDIARSARSERGFGAVQHTRSRRGTDSSDGCSRPLRDLAMLHMGSSHNLQLESPSAGRSIDRCAGRRRDARKQKQDS